jgi:hypothetical protein
MDSMSPDGKLCRAASRTASSFFRIDVDGDGSQPRTSPSACRTHAAIDMWRARAAPLDLSIFRVSKNYLKPLGHRCLLFDTTFIATKRTSSEAYSHFLGGAGAGATAGGAEGGLARAVLTAGEILSALASKTLTCQICVSFSASLNRGMPVKRIPFFAFQ